MKNKFATFGIVIGGLALMLALVQFWAGPFSPEPSLESSVAEKTTSLRKAAWGALTGKKEEQVSNSYFDIDKAIQIGTAVLGGLAFIFAALSFSNNESKRAAGSAAVMGASAVAFQFIAMYVVIFLVVLAILAVVSIIGDGF